MGDEPGWLGRAAWGQPVLPEPSAEETRRVRTVTPLFFAVEAVAFVGAAFVDRATSSIGWGFVTFVGGALLGCTLIALIARRMARPRSATNGFDE